MTTHTLAIALDQRPIEAFQSHKKQLEQGDFNWATSMGNPISHSPDTPILSWANTPEIPEPWELLESPQAWVNGKIIPDNLIYNNTSTPTCDFQSTFSSTNSPLLEETDSFNTFANVDFSLHSLIPTIESNNRVSFMTTQKELARRNGIGSLDAVYHQPSSPISHPETYTSDHIETSRKTTSTAKATKDRSQRHTTVGSDTPSSQDSDEEKIAERRRKNKLAARKLRQKKLDQVSELEAQLEDIRRERDALRLRAAKSEGELMALRQMIDQK
ncbi:hypothetical protein N7481_012213 [Penicillium waksmanii]|uniref:uncharacterized protein n=1 Tax=Penicillium waksmanii TaxID=69791 RepID=UPI002548ECE8|nr:uncharacterized protein N7481_012213 [Penicillium waksmanii]KAJ5965499.1 hypothetical protein N7481_012213 [Penicillium waksmanii]